MKPAKTVFVCRDCGAHASKWMGQCSGCGAWHTLAEEPDRPASDDPGAGRYGLASGSGAARLYAEIEVLSQILTTILFQISSEAI